MRPERRSAPPVLTEGRVPFLFYALIRDRCEAPSGACRRNCMRKALAGPFSVSPVGKGVVRGYARSVAGAGRMIFRRRGKSPSGQTVGAFGGACGTPPSHAAASCRLVAAIRRSFLPPLRSSAGSPRRFRRGQTAAASPAGAVGPVRVRQPPPRARAGQTDAAPYLSRLMYAAPRPHETNRRNTCRPPAPVRGKLVLPTLPRR